MATKQVNDGKTDTYLALIREMPLRSITTARQLAAAQTMINRLLARKLDAGEEDYLGALTDLVEKYESDSCDFGSATCAQLLAFLIEDRGLTRQKLSDGAGISKSTISELLNGRRAATVELAKKLGIFFGIAPSVFIDCK
jgi:HTH-type transcriptional regulator/antitoxin HigA